MRKCFILALLAGFLAAPTQVLEQILRPPGRAGAFMPADGPGLQPLLPLRPHLGPPGFGGRCKLGPHRRTAASILLFGCLHFRPPGFRSSNNGRPSRRTRSPLALLDRFDALAPVPLTLAHLARCAAAILARTAAYRRRRPFFGASSANGDGISPPPAAIESIWPCSASICSLMAMML